MSTAPLPKLVELAQPGPYETPVAEGLLGLGVFGGELPARLRLVLRGGIELRIPLDDSVQEELRTALNSLAEGAASEGV